MTPSIDREVWNRPYNTPLEAGLRAVILLMEAFPAKLDLSRLLYFDYLVVHSGDVPNGPPSLHPVTPLRSGELLVRRGLIEQGLGLMASRGLIDRWFDSSGITFCAAESAAPFINALGADYTLHMRDLSRWVIDTFLNYTGEELDVFIRANVDRWGAEFEVQSLIREISQWQ